MGDIHSLQQRYFKDKPGIRDVKPETVDDMHNKITKNEYIYPYIY